MDWIRIRIQTWIRIRNYENLKLDLIRNKSFRIRNTVLIYVCVFRGHSLLIHVDSHKLLKNSGTTMDSVYRRYLY